MSEDVTVDTPEVAQTEDVKVEEPAKVEAEDKEDSSPEAETEEQVEEKPKTVEEKLADLEAVVEKETKAKEALQRKVDRQTAAYNDLQSRLQRERQEAQNKAQEAVSEIAEEPKMDDFDSFDEYKDALVEWETEKRVKQREAEAAQKQAEQKAQELLQERTQRVMQQEAEFIQNNPDYESAKTEFTNFTQMAKVNPHVEAAVVEQAHRGNVPELINYFGANNGENIGELERISKLSPVEAAIEIYKIQESLKSVEAPKKEVKPKPKPVNAPKSNTGGKKPLEKQSGSEILKWVNS